MFVNRVRELEFLERLFLRPGGQMLVLWGRWRVGKTALLKHFAQGKPVLYFVGTQATEKLTLEAWSAQAADFFDDPLLRVQPLTSWEAWLAYLAQRQPPEAGPWGLILDEFPYLVEGAPRLPSLLQAAWDGGLKDRSVRLVLCGSSVAMMESTFFSPRAPLYGRRTGQWKVEPFQVPELGQMMPGLGLVELLERYCVIGGVPMYAERLDPRAPLLENIRRHLLTKGESLYEEVPFLLREELREPRVYQSVLASIAGGARKFGELASKTGLDKSHLTGYLGTLGELGLVSREVPVTEPHPEKSRRGLYFIQDPFVSFWYRFVYPELSRLEMGDLEGVAGRIERQLHDYLSQCVERPLAVLLLRGLLGDLPFPPAFVGRHWSASEEFDLVALDAERRRAWVAEVKWSRTPVSAGLGEQLAARVRACPALQGLEVTRAVIARAGFRGPGEADTRWIDLSTLKP